MLGLLLGPDLLHLGFHVVPEHAQHHFGPVRRVQPSHRRSHAPLKVFPAVPGQSPGAVFGAKLELGEAR